ncbi:MAG TPA: hypothetical protein VFZ25_05535, partial [Chloroflexota bacterium]|nr:hypothetical protein [Chloroflexota bacterium]
MKSDGTVWAWGRNQQGQLGDGTTTDSTTPIQVSGLSGVVAIAVGGATSFALKSDGTVWAWGRNDVGQLGTSAAGTNSTVPVPVSITSVTKIGAGATHGLALRSDGSAWAWGNDVNGELGDGGSCGTSCSTPVQVANLTTTAFLAGGEIHSLAVKADGTVSAWGGGAEGQLGNGATADSFTPVQVSNLSGVTGALSTTYAYDGDGKRASKTVGSTTTSYVYDVNGSLPNVLTDGTLKYVYG